MGFWGRLIITCTGLGIAVGVTAVTLLPVNIPVAIAFGVVASAFYAGGYVARGGENDANAKKKSYEKQTEEKSSNDANTKKEANEKQNLNNQQFTPGEEKIFSLLLKYHMSAQGDKNEGDFESLSRAFNSHVEKSEIFQHMTEGRLDYLEIAHDSKRRYPEDGSGASAAKPAEPKEKISDALARHGLHPSANKGDFEPQAAAAADGDKKPVRKVLRF